MGPHLGSHPRVSDSLPWWSLPPMADRAKVAQGPEPLEKARHLSKSYPILGLDLRLDQEARMRPAAYAAYLGDRHMRDCCFRSKRPILGALFHSVMVCILAVDFIAVADAQEVLAPKVSGQPPIPKKSTRKSPLSAAAKPSTKWISSPGSADLSKKRWWPTGLWWPKATCSTRSNRTPIGQRSRRVAPISRAPKRTSNLPSSISTANKS